MGTFSNYSPRIPFNKMDAYLTKLSNDIKPLMSGYYSDLLNLGFEYLPMTSEGPPLTGLNLDLDYSHINPLQDIKNLDYDKILKERPDITATSKGTDLTKAGNVMSYVGMASDLVSGFLPEKTEYAGPKGELTQTLDTTYDAISNAAMSFGPVGAMVGGIMKGASLLGKGLNALGGGTDGMTTTDAILGSSFLNWTPFGVINGFGGSKADTITKNKYAFEAVGSSYAGTTNIVDDALTKSGKKYGLFSNSARKEANREIAEANRQLIIMSSIADDALNRFAIKDAMSAINSNRYAFNLLGGYNLSAVRIGRNGFSTETILKAKQITSAFKYKKGGKTQDAFKYYLSTLPENQRGSSLFLLNEISLDDIPEFKEGGLLEISFDSISEEYLKSYTLNEIFLDDIPEFKDGGTIRTLELLITYAKEKNPRFIQRLSESPRGIEFIDDKGNKGIGNVYLEWGHNDEGNAIIYPRILEMEDKSLKFLSKDEAFKRAYLNDNILIMSPEEAQIFFAEDPEYQTAYKRGWPEMFKNYSEKVEIKEEYPQEYIDFKNSLPNNLKNTPESEYRTYLYWQLWGKPKDFQYTLKHPNEDGNYMYNWDTSDNSYHGSSIAWGKDGVGYFIKPKHHSTLKYELDWFNKGIVTEEGGKQREMTSEEHKEWEDFKKKYTLEEDGNFYKYVPIKQSENFKTGGTIKDPLGNSDIPEVEETILKNVIPEGALHARLHHMENADNLTKKGIPVVSEKENGELEQQAEIERDEVIFRLEVTKKIEELRNKYNNSDISQSEKDTIAIEAGKLLAYELLENTVDNTGLLNTIS